MPGCDGKPKLGKRAFFGLKFGAPMPLKVFEWQLAFDTGWTLEYIRSLRYGDLIEYIQVKDAMAKAKI